MAKKDKVTVEVKETKWGYLEIPVRGVVPLVVHNWSEKAIREMLEKQLGLKVKQRRGREPKDPAAEYRASMYHMDAGGYGFPAPAFKRCLMNALIYLKKMGQTKMDKTDAQKCIFIEADGLESREIVIPLQDGTEFRHYVTTPLVEIKGEPKMRMDMVRISMNTADVRFRAEFSDWTALLRIKYDADFLSPDVVGNLVYRGGAHVGIGEGRPEKNDQGWGRFVPDK